MTLLLQRQFLSYRRYHHLKESDLQRQLLNYLSRTGPAFVTEIVLTFGLNNAYVRLLLKPLIAAELVSIQPPRRTGSLRVSADHPNVKQMFVITEKGKDFVDKMNKLELMMSKIKSDKRRKHKPQ